MNRREDRKWELINEALSAESSGKSPRLFSSRRTLFGIPSALDQELEVLSSTSINTKSHPKSTSTNSQDPSKNKSSKSDKSDAKASRHATHQTRSTHPTRTAHSTHVVHPLEPVFDGNSRILILGTMPSPKSRETGFYYNHPQNRFWKIMAKLFDEPLPQSNEEKRALVLRHNIALWDVLAECRIEGASDATIAECVPNDIGYILEKAPIESIYCTGTKAYELYAKYCEQACGITATKLPSTSSANASMSLDDLIREYKVITQR